MLSWMILSLAMQAAPMQATTEVANDTILAVATDPPKRPHDPGTGTGNPPPHRPKVPPVSGPQHPKRPHGHQQPGHGGTGKGEPGPKKPVGGGS